jgi:glycosyltransferase involved in cell wall biosynthesis
MRLSILICTLPERADKLKRLTDILDYQIAWFKDHVHYSIHDAGRGMPTGKKRNELINQTSGEYFVFIDDDDVISDDYVEEIMKAIEQKPDVVTFKGFMTTNGEDRRDWTIKLGSKYEERNGHYYRWPNHIVPMRRDAVRQIAFPEIWIQEDYQWSKRINDMCLLKTEVHIDKVLYHYDKIHVYNRRERKQRMNK